MVRAIAVHGSATIDGRQEKRPPAPSETREGGIDQAVVRSLAVAIVRRAQARSLPPGPHPGPNRRSCRPPLPPAPHQALSTPPYLPAPIIVLLTPVRRSASLSLPTPLPPLATTTPTTSAALTPRGTRFRRTTGCRWLSPHCCRPRRPGREGV